MSQEASGFHGWEGECRGKKFLGRLVFSVPSSSYDRRHNNMTAVMLIYFSPQGSVNS